MRQTSYAFNERHKENLKCFKSKSTIKVSDANKAKEAKKLHKINLLRKAQEDEDRKQGFKPVDFTEQEQER